MYYSRRNTTRCACTGKKEEKRKTTRPGDRVAWIKGVTSLSLGSDVTTMRMKQGRDVLGFGELLSGMCGKLVF